MVKLWRDYPMPVDIKTGSTTKSSWTKRSRQNVHEKSARFVGYFLCSNFEHFVSERFPVNVFLWTFCRWTFVVKILSVNVLPWTFCRERFCRGTFCREHFVRERFAVNILSLNILSVNVLSWTFCRWTFCSWTFCRDTAPQGSIENLNLTCVFKE